MAYLVNVRKITEDETFVEYAYQGSGWDCERDTGRFRIDKVTEEISVSEEENPVEKIADRGILAVIKQWKQNGVYPDEANWAS